MNRMGNESLDLPPVLQSLMSMPVAGGQAAMQSGMQELRQLGILPTYQEGGMVGPGGMPIRPQGGLAPAGQPAEPLSAQAMELEIQKFVQQNPQQVQQMQQAIMSGLQSGEITMQELNMMTQLAKVAAQNPQMYPQIRQFAIQQGIATEQDLPQEYDQGLVFAILLAAKAAQTQSQGGAMQPQQGAPPVPAPQGGMPMGGMPQAAMQAPVASMRMGGPLPTNSKNKDGSVPIIAHEGEYVIPSDVVRRKGTDFFDKMIGKDGSNGTGSSNS